MLKVLIAVDGSASSHVALEFAQTLLAGKSTTVTVLHVIPEHIVYGKGGAAPIEAYDLPEERTASNALLDRCVQTLKDAGVGPAISQRLATGDPAEMILAAAADTQTDLIVLGSRGLNATQRFLLGSVSTKVVTHAGCAVLVAHPKAQVASVPEPAREWAPTA